MKDRAMKAMAAGNRSGERLPVAPEDQASVGVRLGLQYRCLPLVDVHEQGLGFEWSDGFPEIVAGSSLPGAVLHIAGLEIKGDMVIRHVTSSISTGTQCGAHFRPATEADRARLIEFVDRLRARTRAPVTESRGTVLRSARPDTTAHPLQCPYCLADLEHGQSTDDAICPFCLKAFGR